jgi:hypothetical protein
VPHLGASQVALVQQLVGALRSLEHCVVAAAFTISRADAHGQPRRAVQLNHLSASSLPAEYLALPFVVTLPSAGDDA